MAKSCSIDHTPEMPREYGALPAPQPSRSRQPCAGCAYELGRKQGAEAEGRLRERVRALQDELAALKAARG